jgi:hypothetical protein
VTYLKTLSFGTLAFALAVAATFSGCAAAATLALGSTSLAAGNAAVSSCGVTSLVATRNVDNAGNVTRVDVAAIPLACSGETLSITFVGAANASLGSGSATIGACTTTCSAAITTFGATISAASAVSYSFGVAGS